MAKKKNFQKVAQEKWNEIQTKVWPKTKKELEKGMVEAKKMLNKGEKYIKSVSKKSVKETKKMSLNLKKEQLYHQLGKALAHSQKSKWTESRKANALVKKIKILDREIKKLS
jgi:hypothetical protein